MELTSFLQHLNNVKGHGNQYTALCPAHDDRNASLCISSTDDNKILVKCQAGCSTESIVSSLGLNMTDLFPPKQDTKKASKKIVQEYIYTDSDGQVVHKKIRYEPKGFSQAKLINGKWEYNLKGITPQLYNLCELTDALKRDETVFIVEGEKDVETLRKHKKVATCNTHGAGKGKWLAHYNDIFSLSSVVIIADNDNIGKEFSMEIADSLVYIVNEVKILDLTEMCPDLKEHGDITDVFELMGDKALPSLEKLISSTPPYTKPEPKVRVISLNKPYESEYYEDPSDPIEAKFIGSGYGLYRGGTVQKCPKNDGTIVNKKLCNFVAWCKGEKTIDDGIESLKYFQIEGKHANGRTLPVIDISANDFSNMNWITKMWGFDCNISPGSTTKDKLRHCIQQISNDFDNEILFTYTGWRLYDNKWIYLHGDGAVGSENIKVKLDGKLSNYRFPPSDINRYFLSTSSISELLDVANHNTTYSLLAYTFLSPLNEFLKHAGYEPKFIYFLMGKTGTGKSTITALFLSFFGKFNNTELPLSFMDTANAIINQTFIAKDNLICIDDYKPSTKSDINRMDNTSQVILRSYGERTGRQRLKSDSSLMTQKAPRGNAVITGEMPANVGESGTARFIVSELMAGETDFEKITSCQKEAKELTYSYSMRGYIEWLKEYYLDVDEKGFSDTLGIQFEELRGRISQDTKESVHPRINEALAHLAIGYLYYIKYTIYLGINDANEEKNKMDYFFSILYNLGKEHSELSRNDKPSIKFITKLRELINAKAVSVFGTDLGGSPYQDHVSPFIGYIDENYYYLFSEMTYKVVIDLCNKQGEFFPVGLKTLLKHLADDNYIYVINGEKTPRKTIKGKKSRFIWIPVGVLDEENEL